MSECDLEAQALEPRDFDREVTKSVTREFHVTHSLFLMLLLYAAASYGRSFILSFI